MANLDLNPDLSNLLELELEHLEDEQRDIDRRRTAIMLLLRLPEPEPAKVPSGTFEAPQDALVRPSERKGGMKATLTSAQCREIRKSKETQGQLADRFGVARGTIYNVINKRGAYANV